MGKEGLIGSTWASAIVRVHQTGDVTAITGCQPHGQGQITTFAQIAAHELGVPVDRVEIIHSDTLGVPYAQGSYGSRSFSVEGVAIYEACQLIKQKAVKMGAHLLGAEEKDVEYADGKVQVKSDAARAKTLQEIASALWFAWDVPAGIEPGLEVTSYFDPPDFNFPVWHSRGHRGDRRANWRDGNRPLHRSQRCWVHGESKGSRGADAWKHCLWDRPCSDRASNLRRERTIINARSGHVSYTSAERHA